MKCHQCGKFGHVERDCYSTPREAGQAQERPAKTCYYCGKIGHIQRDCWSAMADRNQNNESGSNTDGDSRSNTDGDSRSNTDGDSQENFEDGQVQGYRQGQGQGYRQGQGQGYRQGQGQGYRQGQGQGYRQGYGQSRDERFSDAGGPRRKMECYNCGEEVFDIRKHKKYDCQNNKKEKYEASPAETLQSLRPGPVDPNSYLSRTKGDDQSESEKQ